MPPLRSALAEFLQPVRSGVQPRKSFLFLAFASLSGRPETGLKVVAAGLAVGIRQDATRGPGAAGVGPGLAVWSLELVAAGVGRPTPGRAPLPGQNRQPTGRATPKASGPSPP